MPLNKPPYSLFNNTKYALSGIVDMIQNETSFRLQLLLFIIMSIIAFILPIKFHFQFILSLSLFIPILAEVINSAIERVVDLNTLEEHELAKKAKDVGASLVFVSFIVTAIIWIGTIYIAFS